MEQSKKETGKIHLTEQMPSLLINNEKVKDPEKIADVFNSFFQTIVESLNLHQVGKEDAILIFKRFISGKFPSIKTIPSTEAEIKSIVHSLKSKKLSGYDEITSKILKVCSSLISSRPLTNICNYIHVFSLIVLKFQL
jgi:hypothetical protein